MLAVPAPVIAQTTVTEADQDEIDPIADLPIESEVYAPALTFTNQTGGVTTYYGQVNLAYQRFDDGDAVTDGIVDNGNWNTRLGVTVAQPHDIGTLTFRFETGLGLRNGALISQDSKPPVIDWQRTALRWFEVALDTDYGQVSLGQGSMAADGTAGLDDSFTFHAGAADSSDGFGSFRFRDDNGALTDVTVAQVNASFGGARRFRIRYDTPRLEGFILATSYGRNVLSEDDDTRYSDVAIRWSGDIGDIAIRSAASYQWLDVPGGLDTERVAASAALVHTPTGLNLAVSTGAEVGGAGYAYSRAGWRSDLFAVGTTSLSADYYLGRDFLSDGARTVNYGLYAVQTFDATSIDLYAGWRRLTYADDLGNSYQDADGFLIGARLYF